MRACFTTRRSRSAASGNIRLIAVFLLTAGCGNLNDTGKDPADCQGGPRMSCLVESGIVGTWSCDDPPQNDVFEIEESGYYVRRGEHETGIIEAEGCVECDGTFFGASTPDSTKAIGSFVNVNGRFVIVDAGVAEVGWDFCLGDDLDGCEGNPTGDNPPSTCAKD